MDEINAFLSLLVQGLLIIALPIVITAGAVYAVARWREVKQKLNKDQLETLEKISNIAVKAAEQAGLSGALKSGSEKREFAINTAEKYLAGIGLQVDVDAVVAAVEAQVNEQFAGGVKPVADTPEARSQLLERAVETAVLAAEQSGLAKTAAQAGADLVLSKKDHAVDVAEKYLHEHGIQVDLGLIGNMIEAQVLKFKMDAAKK